MRAARLLAEGEYEAEACRAEERDAREPRRAAAFSSWTRSFIAARSSSVNPLLVLPIAVVLLSDFCIFFGLIENSSY
jgi:hypothetical protein